MQKSTKNWSMILNIFTIVIVAIMLSVNLVIAKPERATSTNALASGVLSYQGTLTDESGNPLTGSYGITFRIFDVPAGGTPLWEEVHGGSNSITVQNGLFSILLGSLTPIPISVWDETQLFLAMKIGDDAEMNPREPIGAVPFALNAGMAQSVPPGSLNSTHVNFTSGSKSATAHLALSTDWQIIPGMQSTITLETPQTLVINLTIQIASDATAGKAVAYVKLVGEGQEYGDNWIVVSFPAGDTASKTFMFNLPSGAYEIQAIAKIEDVGSGAVRYYNTAMNWFSFSNE